MQKLYKNARQMRDEIKSIHNEHIFIDFLHSTHLKTEIENNIFFTQLEELTFNGISLMWSEKGCLEH